MNFQNRFEDLFIYKNQNIEERRKRTFLSICILLIIPVIFLFGLEDMLSGRILEGIFILIIVAVCALELLALKFIKNVAPIYSLSALLVLIPLSYELAVGGGEGYAILWFYFFPIAVFYLTGKKEALFWIALSLLICLFFLIKPVFFEYSYAIRIRFLVTYIIVSMLSLALESSRERYYRELLAEKERLEESMAEIRILRGILPICSSCKKIRDDQGLWNQVEAYIDQHSEAEISHGICPDCAKRLYPDLTIYKD